ncbi:MAG TPA: hypothetical protein VLA92_01125 [Candidatus Saccharimonadales bacterium]|nr:hypothetical protein [Candidatus Saccharimonadales bacterium]
MKSVELPFTVEQLTTPYDIRDGVKATPEEQLANADYMALAISKALTGTRPPSDRVAERYEELPSAPWLGDVVKALIRNDVLTVEPSGLDIAGSQSRGQKKYGLAAASLLRSMAPPNNRMSMVTIHHEPLPNSSSPLAPNQPHFLRTSAARLVEEHAVLRGDIPGKQFTLVPSQQFEGVPDGRDGILHRLKSSSWGSLGRGVDSHLSFLTSPELDAVTLPVWDRLPVKGGSIVLKSLAGQESLSLLHAQALTGMFASDRNHNHLALIDYTYWHSYTGVFALLRATEVLKHHQFHVVSPVLPDEMARDQFVHLMGQQFMHHVERFIKAATVFADFKKFDPLEYVERNYGQPEAMVDDQNICRIVSFALSKLGVRDASAVDIGCGPNPYPAMLLAPFASSIDLLEYSPPNREYMAALLSGGLSDQQMQVWPKFGKHMVEGGGDIYKDALPRLQQMAAEGRVDVRFGDIFKLPKKQWKIASLYFVDDSISIYRSDHREAVASTCEAIEDEGLVVAGNMLNNKKHLGYQAGAGKVFPNISQNALELKQAYTDNKMFSLVIETAGVEKARKGYDGMAVVLAAHSGSEMHRKLETLKPQLEALGFRVI